MIRRLAFLAAAPVFLLTGCGSTTTLTVDDWDANPTMECRVLIPGDAALPDDGGEDADPL